MSHANAVEALLFAALDKPTLAERSAFLDSACAGNAALRRQVEKLLKAHAHVGDFLQKPVGALLAATPEPSDDTQALDAGTDDPDAGPVGRTGHYLARTEGGEAFDEKDPITFLEPSTRSDALGRLGHYEVLEVLGKGGFGIVFRAFDEKLQRLVAIKVLPPEMADDAPARKRFLREARSSARVRHENVVQIYAVEEEPLAYLVIEFVPGVTLQQRLDRTGPMETTEVCRLGRQIADGLAAAHNQGLIHRDIKPGNILIEDGPNQHVKLTDFGLARAADDASLTRSGVVAGTPMFMAPEQASAGPLDHRADLFSLGSVLYMMCTGRPPFRAPNTLAILKRVVGDTPRPIQEIIPEVPAWLCDLIARLHAKKPDDRIATACEVADLLGQGLAALQAPGSVKPSSVAGPAEAHKTLPDRETPDTVPMIQSRSHRRRWLAAAVLFLTLLGGLALTEATGVSHVRGRVLGVFSPEAIREVPDSKVVSRDPVTDTKTGTQGVRVIPAGKDTKPAKVPNPKQPAPAPHEPWTPTPQQKDWLDKVARKPLPQQLMALNRKMMEENKRPCKLVFEPKDGPPTRCMITDGYAQAVWPLLVLPLQSLDLTATAVTDFTPLARLPLTELDVNLIVDNVRSEAALKSMATLKLVNGRPAAKYWAERAAIREEIDDMVLNAPALSLKGRLAWFNSVMRRLNPKWTGQSRGSLSKVNTNGLITLSFIVVVAEGPVFDFSPVRALGLEAIHLSGTWQLCDLSPLAKSKLQIFRYVNANGSLRDLSPLAGLPLKELDLTGAWNLIEISPLAGLKLESFQLWHFSSVTDDKVLHDMPITTLALPHSITDLRPFKTMKLTSLGCSATDLAPLAGMPLETLTIRGSRPADLSPIAGMKLKHFTCIDFNGAWLWFRTDYEPDEKMFRAMPRATINQTPAAKFWAAYDADRKALQEFVTETAKLAPAEAVAAVNEALKKKGRALADSRIEDGAVVEVKLSQVPAKFEPNPLGPLKAFPRLKKITIADISPYHWPNLAPLMKLPIEEIVCTPATVAGNTIILRQMPTLTTINGKPAAEVLRVSQEVPPGAKDDKTGVGAQTLDPDRRAAEYVLSNGGWVKVNEQNKLIKATADLPNESFRLTGITLWNADGNQVKVTDDGLTVFKDCKNLTEIRTYRTRLGDTGLANFKNCRNLTVLSLEQTEAVGDAGLAHFKDCKNLRFLRVTSVPVTDASLVHFKDCKNLTVLSLHGTQVSDAGLIHFNYCKNLTDLNLNNTKTSDVGLAHFKSCKKLERLSLGTTQVSDAGLSHLKDCNKLLFLNLNHTQVGDRGLAHLAALKTLPELDLTQTKVTATGIAELAKALPQCKILWDGGPIKPAESRP